MKRFLFLLLFPIFSFGQLQSSGPIAYSDIMAELGITPGTQTSMTGEDDGFSPFPAGSLHGEKTAPLNSVPPHSMSEWYGYRQVLEFTIQVTGGADAGTACADIGSFTTKWHNGDTALPEVGDTIWNEGTADNLFDGGGNWYFLTGQSKSIRVSNVGVVLQEEACNQTFSFVLNPSTIDSDAQSVTVDVTSNTDWSLSFTDIAELDWVDTGNSPSTGTGNGSKTLNVTQNNTGTDNTFTITGVYGTAPNYSYGTQQSDLTQLAGAFVQVNSPNGLGYSVTSGADACTQYNIPNRNTVYGDTADLSTASVLRTGFNLNPAATGYYSDGTIWKYVINGVVQTGGDFCL